MPVNKSQDFQQQADALRDDLAHLKPDTGREQVLKDTLGTTLLLTANIAAYAGALEHQIDSLAKRIDRMKETQSDGL